MPDLPYRAVLARPDISFEVKKELWDWRAYRRASEALLPGPEKDAMEWAVGFHFDHHKAAVRRSLRVVG